MQTILKCINLNRYHLSYHQPHTILTSSRGLQARVGGAKVAGYVAVSLSAIWRIGNCHIKTGP